MCQVHKHMDKAGSIVIQSSSFPVDPGCSQCCQHSKKQRHLNTKRIWGKRRGIDISSSRLEVLCPLVPGGSLNVPSDILPQIQTYNLCSCGSKGLYWISRISDYISKCPWKNEMETKLILVQHVLKAYVIFAHACAFSKNPLRAHYIFANLYILNYLLNLI